MPEKSLRAFFYQLSAPAHPAQANAESDADYLWGLFTDGGLYDAGNSKAQATNNATSKKCELREVTVVGSVAMGCLALLRDSAPGIRRANGAEDPTPLAAGEHALEKNYFLYFKDTCLLVWQFNLTANHVSNMGLILSNMRTAPRSVIYSHLAKTIFALQAGQVIEYVDLKVATPKRKSEKDEVAQLDPTNWGLNPFKILSDTRARQASVVLQNRTEEGLSGSLRRLVDDLTSASVTRRLKVKVDGMADAVDMLAERYTYKVPMQFTGNAPSADDILSALQTAKDLYDGEKG